MGRLLDAVTGASAQGFIAWNYDVITINNSTAPTAGVLLLNRVRLLKPQGTVVTNLHYSVNTVGSGNVASQNYLGLYSAAGTLVASTADMGAGYTSGTGVKTVALTAPYTAARGLYWVGILLNASGMPALHRSSSVVGAPHLAGQAAANYRWGTSGTGLTALPASFTPGDLGGGAVTYWVAVS